LDFGLTQANWLFGVITNGKTSDITVERQQRFEAGMIVHPVNVMEFVIQSTGFVDKLIRRTIMEAL
jgi:hypothetical protein